MNLTGKITANFSWEEMYFTMVRDLAEENRLILQSDVSLQSKIKTLCIDILQPIREKFGPLVIHSAFRCPALNSRIGGSTTSQHMKAEAADFHPAGAKMRDVFDWVRKESGLKFGQVILEDGNGDGNPDWIHISLGEPWREASRSRQALLFDGKLRKYTSIS